MVSTNKIERTHWAVFYAINRSRIDITQVRNKCKEFRISKLWIDLEAYARNEMSGSQDLFLPWEEFAGRCRMYGINANDFLPSKPLPENDITTCPTEVSLISTNVHRRAHR